MCLLKVVRNIELINIYDNVCLYGNGILEVLILKGFRK